MPRRFCYHAKGFQYSCSRPATTRGVVRAKPFLPVSRNSYDNLECLIPFFVKGSYLRSASFRHGAAHSFAPMTFYSHCPVLAGKLIVLRSTGCSLTMRSPWEQRCGLDRNCQAAPNMTADAGWSRGANIKGHSNAA